MKNLVLCVASAFLWMAAIWQLEYVITCADNHWVYDAPFHLFQCDIWVAHDIWYGVLFIAWLLVFIAYARLDYAKKKAEV